MNIFQHIQSRLLRFSVALLAILSLSTAFAGPGHDHGDEAKPTTVASASPRISSHSDLFELVGIVEKGQLVVYLDRYASNEPVRKATIELEIGSEKLKATEQADGTYLIQSEQLAKPGTLAMSFTITDGKDTDLLAGDLVIPDPHAGHDHTAHAAPWLKWLGWATAGLVGLLALSLAARAAMRFRAKRRHAITSILIAFSAELISTGSTFDGRIQVRSARPLKR